MTFVHLRVHSAYSLAEGAIKIKDLPKLCHKHQMPAVAVTDTNNLFGALEFSTLCADNGIQPIIGCQLNVTSAEAKPNHPLPEPDHLILLVQNEEGYQNLMRLVSLCHLKSPSGEVAQVSLEMIAEHHAGLIALTANSKGSVGRYLALKQFDAARKRLIELKNIFHDRLYIELMRHDLPSEDDLESHFIELAYEFNIPLVATNDVFFSTPDMAEAHDALLCIDEGSYVSELDRRRVTPEHYFKSCDEMAKLFADIPEAIENTRVIAKRCSYRPLPHKPILPAYPTTSGRNESEELRVMASAGLEERLKNQVYQENDSEEQQQATRQNYVERLNYEIDIIEKMGFPGYFLIVADFIQWAKSQGIPVGPGRGSGAGSLVAWALTITDIDPIRFTLLFERFLNPERVSMPDFDIDFCQDRRDEVIQYVRKKYGEDKVAHIITFGKLQARAVLRDVGRVLQMPYGQVDKISKLIPNNPANPVTLEQALTLEPALEETRRSDPSVAHLIDIGMKLEGLYRHASTHAAGVVIGDRPLDQLVALYKDDRSELPATQFNMKYVEMAGLVKFDFLGLKTLTVIEKCCSLIRARNIDIHISRIPLNDPKTFELLSRVETVGIFQVESAGMRDVLRKLRPDRFEDLIALVALYRPGPMDDIPRYLACKHGEEEVTYLHPELKPILEATYGVMVYQEQVMQIAQVLGGYTLGAADLLRRAMGKKIKSEMEAQEALFVRGATHRGIEEAIAKQIFEQMAKFAGYGFNKSHSAPYALLTYQTAYLKANYPLEFYAASMTYEMQNTDKLNVFKQDMERASIPLLPPDINKSHAAFAVEGSGVRYALAAIKNVGEQAMLALVAEREAKGPFKNLTDFANRLDHRSVNKRQLENLIASGALDSIHSNRRELSQNIEHILRFANNAAEERQSQQRSLFSSASDPHTQMLNLPKTKDWGALERLQKEFDALGFYLSAHPLSVYGTSLNKMGLISSAGLREQTDGSTVKLAGVALVKQERTSKTGQKFAFVQCSDAYGVFEVAVFSEVFSRSRDHLVPGTALLITATIRFDGEDFRLTAQQIEFLDHALQQQTQQVKLVLTEKIDIGYLLETLSQVPTGSSSLSIEVMLDQSPSIVIHPPRRFAFSAETRSMLKSIPGLVSVD
jgi:DNA polymerase III subunit alpha